MADDDVPPLEDCSEQLAQIRITRPSHLSSSSSSSSSQAAAITETEAPAAASTISTSKTTTSNVPAKKEFGGMKKGFLFGGGGGGGSSSSSKSKSNANSTVAKSSTATAAAATTTATTDIPFVKPTGKKEDGPGLEHLKNLGISQENLPDWMKPSEDLLTSVASDKVLMQAMVNPKFSKALDEVSKDPKAWEKYKGDPEILEYFRRMCGVFGEQFDKSEGKNANK